MTYCRSLAAAFLGASLVSAQQTERPQVLFSGPPPAAQQKIPAAPSSAVTNAERMAVVISAWDLDVHLVPSRQSLEAQARVTLHNAGASPLGSIPLQLSSTLKFEQVELNGRRLFYAEDTIDSDTDHTGHLHEAAISLPEPLAPRAQISLTVSYGGTIPLSAGRLVAIGAPEEAARSSDWDRISEDFTGLRGFGDVVWYPVSSVPASLARGASVFNEMGRQKLLDQDATVALRITDEFSSEPPNAAVLDGHFVTLDKPASMPSASFPGVITCSLPATPLGFDTPSLFLATREETDGTGVRVLSTDAGAASALGYLAAARVTQPLVNTWLGRRQHEPLTILELPEANDAPAETGDLLVTPLTAAPSSRLEPLLAHGLAHAAFWSPRGWLNEGVAAFIGTLWIETTEGRTAALENLNAGRPALALAEPATPSESGGEDLLHAISAVYYHSKAAYVLWMLRSIAGDNALQKALKAYDPSQDRQPDYFEHLVEQASGENLSWFFDDWVNRDRGLPDLSITNVYSNPEGNHQTVVAIEIANNGYAEAEVPVTVKGINAAVTQQVRVPARGHITHRISIEGKPQEVDVNDGSVPEVQDSIHRKLFSGS